MANNQILPGELARIVFVRYLAALGSAGSFVFSASRVSCIPGSLGVFSHPLWPHVPGLDLFTKK
jgi:hypothetical protein